MAGKLKVSSSGFTVIRTKIKRFTRFCNYNLLSSGVDDAENVGTGGYYGWETLEKKILQFAMFLFILENTFITVR